MTGGMGGKQVGPMNKVVQHEKSEFIGTVQLSKKKKGHLNLKQSKTFQTK